MTEWRMIDGWPYEVSSEGDVRRAFGAPGTKQGRVLKQQANRVGTMEVTLCHNGRRSTHDVAVLVAGAFAGPREYGNRVAHKDGNKMNNHKDNIVYRDGFNERDTPRSVVEAVMEAIRAGEKKIDIAARFGLSSSQVSGIATGKLHARITDSVGPMW